MKSYSIRYLLILLLALPLITACEDDEAEPEVTKTDLLTSQTWQGSAVFASGIDVTDNPELKASIPDVRTLTLDFETDGTYTASYVEDGNNVKTEGEWEFRNNETMLYFDLMDEYDLTIKELTEDHLILTTTVTVQGFTVPAEVHFVAQ